MKKRTLAFATLFVLSACGDSDYSTNGENWSAELYTDSDTSGTLIDLSYDGDEDVTGNEAIYTYTATWHEDEGAPTEFAVPSEDETESIQANEMDVGELMEENNTLSITVEWEDGSGEAQTEELVIS
ncbi:hypothetical protein [Shouchella shacheensis]|uniref:hypothetical protein n=1 Tax=Shouchella shacheensis TaxID=1649580 RepID=UPI00073FAFFF|nr:hypothetical protein [Shouchella shacheensis]